MSRFIYVRPACQVRFPLLGIVYSTVLRLAAASCHKRTLCFQSLVEAKLNHSDDEPLASILQDPKAIRKSRTHILTPRGPGHCRSIPVAGKHNAGVRRVD